MKLGFTALICGILAGCQPVPPKVALVPQAAVTAAPTATLMPVATPIIIQSDKSNLPPLPQAVDAPSIGIRPQIRNPASAVASTRAPVSSQSPLPVEAESPRSSAETTPVPIGNSTIRNDSGRWLQVDVLDESGRGFDTLNCRYGEVQSIPDNARQLKVRVNDNSIDIDRGGMRIVIDGQEKLVED